MIPIGAWLARDQCTNCGFVSSDSALTQTDSRCPNCGHSDASRAIYPSGSGIELLNLIDYFFQITARQHERVWTQAAVAISRDLGRKVSRTAAYEGWRRVNRAYSGSINYGPELVALSRMFRCDSETASRILLSYWTNPEEEAAELPMVPICTVTLIETMLSWLLRCIEMNLSGLDWRSAREKVVKLQSFESRYEAFRNLTQTDFQRAVESIDKSFWSDWSDVRKKRNLFVHGNAYALGWLACERAHRVAGRSVAIFATLHNRFAIRLAALSK